jgi:hypothetical protein
MLMMIKIYFGEKPVFLCDSKDPLVEELLHHPDTILIEEISHHAIHALLHEIKKETFHAGVLMNPDFDMLKKTFFHYFTSVEAAGGLVRNETGELLFIFRRGKWDLPKGKMEAGEDPAECAEREIEEETGIRDITIVKKICETYHVYEEYGKTILKTTHWFACNGSSKGLLIPQTEEDILEAKWVSEQEVPELMKNTYSSVREVVLRG